MTLESEIKELKEILTMLYCRPPHSKTGEKILNKMEKSIARLEELVKVKE